MTASSCDAALSCKPRLQDSRRIPTALCMLSLGPGVQEADDDEEDKPAPKPKEKNPLDLLPPSKMMLDSWKRLYSNTPAAQFRQIAIKGLWEGADVPRSLTNEVQSLLIEVSVTVLCGQLRLLCFTKGACLLSTSAADAIQD